MQGSLFIAHKAGKGRQQQQPGNWLAAAPLALLANPTPQPAQAESNPSQHTLPLQPPTGCYGIRWTHFVTWQNSVAYISGVANVQHWLARPTGKLATGPPSVEPAQAQLTGLHNPACHSGGCCSKQAARQQAEPKQNHNCTCCWQSAAFGKIVRKTRREK